MELSEEDRQLAIELLQRGEPLPDRFRFSLFREPREAELIWPGKTNEVTQAILPFQSIEQIDEPRAEAADGKATLDLFSRDAGSCRQAGGWSNKLIWGDNKLVLSSLKNGPLRREIEKAGGLKLVYIDPPFDVGADFSFNIEIGEDFLVKEATVLEEVAYRDTWGRGKASYLSMISERIRLIYDLMSDGTSLFLRLDWHTVPECWSFMNELFNSKYFHNDLIWYYYRFGVGGRKQFTRAHDTVLWFSKGGDWKFNLDGVRVPYSTLQTQSAA